MPRTQLTLVQREDAVHVYWHEQHGYWLSDWQPVFKKGVNLRRAYQACIDAALARRGAPWLVDARKFAVIDPRDLAWIEDWFWPEFVNAGARYEAGVLPAEQVSKLSASRAMQKVLRSGRFELTVHATREQAEAAILAWQEKQRR